MDSAAVKDNNNKPETLNSYKDDWTDSEITKTNSSLHQVSDDDDDIISSHKRASSPISVEKEKVLLDHNAEENKEEHLNEKSPKPAAQQKKHTDDPSDNESESEPDAYSFTEDQRRAMMELMVQKQEDSDLLDEEPPEYNVKGRLEQLNAELANDPTPVEGDRETRVGFKPEIVDLVAPPPPDFSDDESQPNSARGDPPKADPESGDDLKVKNDNSNKEQYVVERDGNFSVVSASDLSPLEREMLITKESQPDTSEKQHENSKTDLSSASVTKINGDQTDSLNKVQPKPPTKPRPKTTGNSFRRNVKQGDSTRPKSAVTLSSSNYELENYHSPYAMTPEQKEEARKEKKRLEEEKQKSERKKKEEEEERKKESVSAFQAWLDKKLQENKKKTDENDEEQFKKEKRKHAESLDSSQNNSFDTLEVIYPYLLRPSMKEESEKAYKLWLKEKKSQVKKDKLLKKRQQQEHMEGFFIRSREECEKAFKEWLKRKNAEKKKYQAIERQKYKIYKLQMKRSKKSNAYLKSLNEQQAFQSIDYYGYRY
ncbi:coiled-coil domain-containing protein 181-like isoform X2 [Physella acuta]|uniref:coiled-coil domain-containing protein 181-like isoform X2 n=1 Tax=Physella acuta TaxID=109671 RepID=UPI0027DD6D90|nr:coiled-coil domain-containing protein 181-like isoform X2 [Physella acuta]